MLIISIVIQSTTAFWNHLFEFDNHILYTIVHYGHHKSVRDHYTLLQSFYPHILDMIVELKMLQLFPSSIIHLGFLPVYSAHITGCSDAIVSWFPIWFDFTVTNRTFDHLVIINVFMYDFTFRKKMEFHAETSVWIFLSI